MGGGNNWSRSPSPRGRAADGTICWNLLDRLSPTIAELSQTIEQEVEKYPEARRLMTHPGVGPLTALAFVLIIGTRRDAILRQRSV